MAKHKYIETPEKLLQMWEHYKTHVKSNPRYKHELNKFGEVTAIPLERPLTQEGFNVFCFNKYKVTVEQYFTNQDNAYNEYLGICNVIKEERRNDQIEGGMVGQYNASITQRLNGLTESVKNDHTTQGEKINIVSLGSGIKPDESNN